MAQPIAILRRHFPPKGVNMLLISRKPVTQSLTKNLEPLTQLNKPLKWLNPRYDCNGVLNLLLSTKSRLTSFRHRLPLKIEGKEAWNPP
jgi:hypothetical protein